MSARNPIYRVLRERPNALTRLVLCTAFVALALALHRCALQISTLLLLLTTISLSIKSRTDLLNPIFNILVIASLLCIVSPFDLAVRQGTKWTVAVMPIHRGMAVRHTSGQPPTSENPKTFVVYGWPGDPFGPRQALVLFVPSRSTPELPF